MDPIAYAVKNDKNISALILIQAINRLNKLQQSQSTISYDEILQSLTNLTSEIELYAAVIYEAALAPVVTSKGQLSLQIHRDVAKQDTAILERVLHVLLIRSDAVDTPMIEEFRRDLQSLTMVNQGGGAGNSMISPSQPGSAMRPSDVSDSSSASSRARNFLLSAPFTAHLNDMNDLPPENYRSPLSRIEFEKSEPIVRLLAQVRKIGMDILFPQSTHDKVNFPIINL